MSDHVARPSHDEDATSMTSSQVHQPSWMSRWMNNSSKPGSIADNSSFLHYNKGQVDSRALVQSGFKTEDSLQPGKGVSKKPEETKTGAYANEDLTKKLGNFKNKFSNLSFPTLTLGQYKDNASTVGTEVDHEFGHKSMFLALTGGKEDTSRDFNLRNSKQQAMSHLFQEQKGKGISTSSNYNKSDASKPVVVFERHFSNDNFTCFSQDRCKYQKSSSVLFHEKKMGNDLCHESGLSDGVHLQHGCPTGKKNFQSFFLKQQSQNGGQPLDSVPCSFRNVETMRICTMVDSVENSPGDPPKISQRAQHILFTKETRVNMSKGHQVIVEPTSANQEEKTFGGPFSMFSNVAPRSRGVKIQPLWISTDDSEEKENTANHSICKEGSRNEASAETNGMQLEAPKNRHNLLGVESSPLTKDDTMDYTMDESNSPAACDSSTEKTRSKRPIRDIPDINEEAEELPGLQPAVSSTNGKDPTHPNTSRVRSLKAKQLFSSHEQTSRSESNTRQERSLGPDNRWIKRLKVSSSDSLGVGTKSSDMGEDSSHEKYNTFFNRITKYNKESFDAKLRKHNGKAQMEIDQKEESPRNGGSSSLVAKNKNQSMLGCSWIQRWCQNSTAPTSNPEPLVICEPHRLKIGQDELAKRQFPSIGAMALMGKAMNGIRSCEFKKRGSIVVWNTKEF